MAWYSVFESAPFWLFVGLVAGTFVQFAAQWCRDTINERRMVKDFLFELNAMRIRLAEFSEINQRFRQAIDTKQLPTFREFFPLNGLRAPVGNLLYASGALYRLVKNHQHVTQFIRISDFYTPGTQQGVATQIATMQAQLQLPPQAIATTTITWPTPNPDQIYRDAMTLYYQLETAFRNDPLHIQSLAAELEPIAKRGFIRYLFARIFLLFTELL